MTSKTYQRLIYFAVFLLGSQPVYAQSNRIQESQTMDHDQIHSTIETNNSAVFAGDIEEILATFEPNGVLIAQPGTLAKGTPALREAFKQFIAISPKITVTDYEVIQTGDIALHSSTWKMSGKTPDGHPVEQSGFSVVVLRKQPDGRWLMVIDNPFGDQLARKK